MKDSIPLLVETENGKKMIYKDISNFGLGTLINLRRNLEGTDDIRAVDKVLYDKLYIYRSYFDYTDSSYRKEEKKNIKIKRKKSFKFKGGRK